MCKQSVTMCFVSHINELRRAESFLIRHSVVQKLPAFNGNQSFMAMFATASQWFLPQARAPSAPFLSPHNYFQMHFNVIFPSISSCSKSFLLYG